MPQPYRTILGLPGALAFSSFGWLARLPISMVGLGFVLLVSARTGSYGLAGTVSAAYVLAAAVAAPLQARLADRLGQHKIILGFAHAYSLAIGSTIVVVEAGLSTPYPQVLAGLAGAASPQIGAYVRARWAHLLKGKPELQTAFALEALLDEVVFMVGPPLVTVLATSFSPVAGLIAAIVSGLVGSVLLASHRRSEPPVHGEDGAASARRPLGWATLAPVILACVGLGVLFGGNEVVVVAFASEQRARSVSGVLLAIWAAGSMLAALILG
ncbi:MAG TPA: MFS transporter, partial [Actinopolymorphaceae bacterium]